MIPSDVPLVLPCLTNLLLNDEETIYMCENDIMGGVTMLLLRILTDEPSILIDAGEIDWENNAIRFFSCGSVTSGFAKGGRKGIRLSENYELLGRGCSAEFTLRLGRVTLCRFQKVGQDMVMHIARGKIVDSAYKRIPRWPEGVVKLDCSVRTFIEQTYTYHYHIVYHDIVDELVECCGLLGVKPVVT
jgi:L-fucose isomerase-like protein